MRSTYQRDRRVAAVTARKAGRERAKQVPKAVVGVEQITRKLAGRAMQVIVWNGLLRARLFQHQASNPIRPAPGR
jgi:hypothetical protein